MTALEDAEHLAEALKTGASGYVLKTAPLERTTSAIRRALEGEAPLNQELAKKLILSLLDEKRVEQEEPESLDPEVSPQQASVPALDKGLTPREVEVLRLIAQGQTNQQIAKGLLISSSTVKNHVQRILAKLGASDRTQAVVIAIEMEMLSDPF